MTYKRDEGNKFTEEQRKKILASGDKIIIQMNEKTGDFFTKLRRELLLATFNSKYKCLRCKSKEEIQIHHIYYFAPKDIIDNYEDFKKIPWVPLCKTCHMEEHQVEPPEVTEDD